MNTTDTTWMMNFLNGSTEPLVDTTDLQTPAEESCQTPVIEYKFLSIQFMCLNSFYALRTRTHHETSYCSLVSFSLFRMFPDLLGCIS